MINYRRMINYIADKVVTLQPLLRVNSINSNQS